MLTCYQIAEMQSRDVWENCKNEAGVLQDELQVQLSYIKEIYIT